MWPAYPVSVYNSLYDPLSKSPQTVTAKTLLTFLNAQNAFLVTRIVQDYPNHEIEIYKQLEAYAANTMSGPNDKLKGFPDACLRSIIPILVKTGVPVSVLAYKLHANNCMRLLEGVLAHPLYREFKRKRPPPPGGPTPPPPPPIRSNTPVPTVTSTQNKREIMKKLAFATVDPMVVDLRISGDDSTYATTTISRLDNTYDIYYHALKEAKKNRLMEPPTVNDSPDIETYSSRDTLILYYVRRWFHMFAINKTAFFNDLNMLIDVIYPDQQTIVDDIIVLFASKTGKLVIQEIMNMFLDKNIKSNVVYTRLSKMVT